MPSTPSFGFPFPALSEPANGPVAFQNLAEAAETALKNRLGVFFDRTAHTGAPGVGTTGVEVFTRTYASLFPVPYVVLMISGAIIVGSVAGAEPSLICAIRDEGAVELVRRENRNRVNATSENVGALAVAGAVVTGGFSVVATVTNRSGTGTVTADAGSSSHSIVMGIPLHINYPTDLA
jgi:hypothetical protein